MGEATTIKVGIGDLEFRVDPDRAVDSGDHGPTVWVFVRGEEALRFDCFQTPHYHYVPTNERFAIDQVLMGAGSIVEWVFEQINHSLDTMLRHVGYLEAAQTLLHEDRGQVYDALSKVAGILGTTY